MGKKLEDIREASLWFVADALGWVFWLFCVAILAIIAGAGLGSLIWLLYKAMGG